MIKYYSIHCGLCETVCWLMDSREISYTLIDDPQTVVEAAREHNTDVFPFAVIDGEFYNTDRLLNYILEYNK